MNEKQISDLEDRLKTFIQKLVEEQFKVLHRKFDNMQDTVNIIDKEMGNDRRDIGEIKIIFGGMKMQFEEIITQFGKQTRTIVNKIEDKVVEQVERIEDKMIETVEPVVQNTLDDFVSTEPKVGKKRKFFKRLFRRK